MLFLLFFAPFAFFAASGLFVFIYAEQRSSFHLNIHPAGFQARRKVASLTKVPNRILVAN